MCDYNLTTGAAFPGELDHKKESVLRARSPAATLGGASRVLGPG